MVDGKKVVRKKHTLKKLKKKKAPVKGIKKKATKGRTIQTVSQNVVVNVTAPASTRRKRTGSLPAKQPRQSMTHMYGEPSHLMRPDFSPYDSMLNKYYIDGVAPAAKKSSESTPTRSAYDSLFEKPDSVKIKPEPADVLSDPPVKVELPTEAPAGGSSTPGFSTPPRTFPGLSTVKREPMTKGSVSPHSMSVGSFGFIPVDDLTATGYSPSTLRTPKPVPSTPSGLTAAQIAQVEDTLSLSKKGGTRTQKLTSIQKKIFTPEMHKFRQGRLKEIRTNRNNKNTSPSAETESPAATRAVAKSRRPVADRTRSRN